MIVIINLSRKSSDGDKGFFLSTVTNWLSRLLLTYRLNRVYFVPNLEPPALEISGLNKALRFGTATTLPDNPWNNRKTIFKMFSAPFICLPSLFPQVFLPVKPQELLKMREWRFLPNYHLWPAVLDCNGIIGIPLEIALMARFPLFSSPSFKLSIL